MGGWSTALNVGGKVARFAGHSPKKFLGLTAGSVVGWKYFVNDESLLEQATEVALGDDASKGLKEKGVTGGLKGLAFGAEGADKSIGENVVDGMIGEGTYDHISHAAGNAVDAVGNGVHAAGEGVQNAFQGAGQMVQGYQQQAVVPQQGGGLFSALNPFDSISQVANSFWSGGRDEPCRPDSCCFPDVRQFRLDGKDRLAVPWLAGHEEHAHAAGRHAPAGTLSSGLPDADGRTACGTCTALPAAVGYG